MSDYPQGSRDIIRLQFGTFSFLFFLFLEKRASYLYKHQLDYSGLFFFTFGGNMLCSQENMPATQGTNMVQPILPCNIYIISTP